VELLIGLPLLAIALLVAASIFLRQQDSNESASRTMTKEPVSSDTSTSKQTSCKFCINCGTEVVRLAKFCHACGTPTILREKISAAPQVEVAPAGQTNQDDIQKHEVAKPELSEKQVQEKAQLESLGKQAIELAGADTELGKGLQGSLDRAIQAVVDGNGKLAKFYAEGLAEIIEEVEAQAATEPVKDTLDRTLSHGETRVQKRNKQEQMLSATEKQQRLAELSKILGNTARSLPSEGNVIEWMEGQSKTHDQLIRLIVEDKQLSETMAEYHADKDTLENIYSGLKYSGGGQWVAGSYLPVAALATEPTLRFLLKCVGTENTEEQWTQIVMTLIRYFESGSTGPVE
jgi:hypothetical protein